MSDSDRAFLCEAIYNYTRARRALITALLASADPSQPSDYARKELRWTVKVQQSCFAWHAVFQAHSHFAPSQRLAIDRTCRKVIDRLRIEEASQ